MNDKQKNIIDKLNKDNESLNQGHKSMVEYSKGMIYIGLFVVGFLIYYFTKNAFLFGFLLFEIFNSIYAKNDKKKIVNIPWWRSHHGIFRKHLVLNT